MIDYDRIIEHRRELGLYRSLRDKVLAAIAREGSMTLYDILRHCGGSDRRVLRLLHQMAFHKELRISCGRVRPLEKLRRNSKGSKLRFESIVKDRPRPTFFYDQRPVTVSTSLRRAAYLSERGDLDSKKILFLGDDDLTSIACALYGTASELYVVDMDRRILEFIDRQSQKYSLGIKTSYYDALEQPPRGLRNRFDVFFTDPTPEPKPFSLFINRAVAMLKAGPGRAGYLCFQPSHSEVKVVFQRILTRQHLVITDMVPNATAYTFIPETFSEADEQLVRCYGLASEVGFFENLTRVVTTAKTSPVSLSLKRQDLYGRATKRVLKNPAIDPGQAVKT